MAVDKLVDSAQLNSDLTSVANAIRTKGGTSAQLAFPSEFISAINAISGGGAVAVVDTLDAAGGTIRTITAEDQLTNRTSSDLAVSGATVSVPSGYYPNNASASVASGTAGTPTASKGTVSNHSISVTPSVTNTTGYVTGGTKTGTAVTVTASELASGNKEITANGTNIDVVGYSTVSVSVSGGGSTKNIQVNSNAASVKNNGYTASTITLTVAKTGTYTVSWTAWRSSAQGTMGTNLHRNSTAGTNQQTFTNTYGQHIVLSNQSYTQGDVLTLYGTSGSTSRYIWISNLIIEEQ